MHAAPPVRIAVAADGLWPRAQVALAAIAAAVLVLWGQQWAEAPVAWQLAAAAAAAALGALVAFVTLPRVGADETLVWDGKTWSLAAERGRVDVMLDLDRWLLLRFFPTGGRRARWLAVREGTSADLFRGWRAALYATPPAAASALR